MPNYWYMKCFISKSCKNNKFYYSLLKIILHIQEIPPNITFYHYCHYEGKKRKETWYKTTVKNDKNDIIIVINIMSLYNHIVIIATNKKQILIMNKYFDQIANFI